MVDNAQLEALLRGRLDVLRASGPPWAGPQGGLVFPGAFDPLHDGHRQMATVAARVLQVPTEFELSIQNVDKPALEAAEILTRLEQFDRTQVVWLTNADTFVKKARVFHGSGSR